MLEAERYGDTAGRRGQAAGRSASRFISFLISLSAL